MKRIQAYAPASIGNVAAGFDVMGAALAPLDGSPLGDRVTLTEASTPAFEASGAFAHRLPADPAQNLVLKAKALFEEAYGALPPFAIHLDKALPVNSGLGSSAASIVAALVAFNAWVGEPYGPGDLLALAGRAEATVSGSVHFDNVAPSLLGGLRLVVPGGKARALPFPADLAFVVLRPDLEVATKDARAALPTDVPLADAVAFGANLAAFVQALHAQDSALLAASFKDVLAEPHRAGLVKGFREVQAAALEAGALGCSLSGSGPAVFAVAEEGEEARAVADAMVAAFHVAGVRAEALLCGLDAQGARIL
ncbi:MAG: homoserine kinase [Holophagaceae bacterium]